MKRTEKESGCHSVTIIRRRVLGRCPSPQCITPLYSSSVSKIKQVLRLSGLGSEERDEARDEAEEFRNELHAMAHHHEALKGKTPLSYSSRNMMVQRLVRLWLKRHWAVTDAARRISGDEAKENTSCTA